MSPGPCRKVKGNPPPGPRSIVWHLFWQQYLSPQPLGTRHVPSTSASSKSPKTNPYRSVEWDSSPLPSNISFVSQKFLSYVAPLPDWILLPLSKVSGPHNDSKRQSSETMPLEGDEFLVVSAESFVSLVSRQILQLVPSSIVHFCQMAPDPSAERT